jgi:iron complex outermembrane recepter protein
MSPHLRRFARSRPLLPLLACVPACLGQVTAPAMTEELVALPQYTVLGDKTNPYAPGDAISAARIRAALSETAASISVISKQVLTDIGADSMLDATRYMSGLSPGQAAGSGGILDRHVVRGFESDGRTVDGFTAGFQANFDPHLIERIEVVKGPNTPSSRPPARPAARST